MTNHDEPTPISSIWDQAKASLSSDATPVDTIRLSEAELANALAEHLCTLDANKAEWHTATLFFHRICHTQFRDTFVQRCQEHESSLEWANAIVEQLEDFRRQISSLPPDATERRTWEYSAFLGYKHRGSAHDTRTTETSMWILSSLHPSTWHAVLAKNSDIQSTMTHVFMSTHTLDDTLSLLATSPPYHDHELNRENPQTTLLARKALRLATAPAVSDDDATNNTSRLFDLTRTRADGARLMLELYTEQMAKALRDTIQTSDASIELRQLNLLIPHVSRPFVALWDDYKNVLKARQPALTQWIASVVASSDLDDHGSATRCIEALAEVLQSSRKEHPCGFSDISKVPLWVFPNVAKALLGTSDPLSSFNTEFKRLYGERRRSRLRPGYEFTAVSSRVLLGIGLGAVLNAENWGSQVSTKELWIACWNSALEIWLRTPLEIGDDLSNIALFTAWHLPSIADPNDDLMVDVARYFVVTLRWLFGLQKDGFRMD